MKVVTVLGTRPEIIRLSLVIKKLDQVCEHIVVHTGQNYDPKLNDIFFEDLGVRAPNQFLGAKGAFGEQVGTILTKIEQLFIKEKPDKFLVLGDTNSALSAIVAKRMGIPVYHMEAGNRCYDDRVPEENNRRIIDHSSDILMPYTERSRENLLQEGFVGKRIYVTGNPILEVINHHNAQIEKSGILNTLNLKKRQYFLVTLHRAENVDIEARLRQLAAGLVQVSETYKLPMIVSTHPHTRSRLSTYGINIENPLIRFMEPFGFFDFVNLERNAKCVLSDSGTVQEECSIFRVPTVTLRDVTERPETVECGSNILSGADPDSILRCLKIALDSSGSWNPPIEYLSENVSETVCKIVFGHRHS